MDSSSSEIGFQSLADKVALIQDASEGQFSLVVKTKLAAVNAAYKQTLRRASTRTTARSSIRSVTFLEMKQKEPEQARERSRNQGCRSSSVDIRRRYEEKNASVSRFDRLAYENKYKHYIRERIGTSKKEEQPPVDDPILREMKEKVTALEGKREERAKLQKKRFDRKHSSDQRARLFQLLPKTHSKYASKNLVFQLLLAKKEVLMMYGIDPLFLNDELELFETEKEGRLSQAEFSCFLLLERDKLDPDCFSANLEAVRKDKYCFANSLMLRQVVAPPRLYQLLGAVFKDLDTFNCGSVPIKHFHHLFHNEVNKRELRYMPVLQYPGLGRTVRLHKLLSKLYFASGDWELLTIRRFLEGEYAIEVPQRDKAVQRLIANGYLPIQRIFLLSEYALGLLKEVFRAASKSGGLGFVNMKRFFLLLYRHPKFQSCKEMFVRKEARPLVQVQNVREAAQRMQEECFQFMDLDEVLDFFSDAGRPEDVERELNEQQRQHRSQEGSDDSDSDFQRVRNIRLQRFSRKIRQNTVQFEQNVEARMKFNITIPLPTDLNRPAPQRIVHQRFLADHLNRRTRELEECNTVIRSTKLPKSTSLLLYQKMVENQLIRKERRKHPRKESSGSAKRQAEQEVKAARQERIPIQSEMASSKGSLSNSVVNSLVVSESALLKEQKKRSIGEGRRVIEEAASWKESDVCTVKEDQSFLDIQ